MESVSDPEAQRFLAMVMRQADRLHALVEDLLNLARLEEGVDRQRFALTPLPIDEVVRTGVEACEAKAAARNVRLEAECPADLVVPMQPGLLENAITNLLDNGIKYSPAGGAVRLAVRTTEGEVVLEVADRGCGIEPEHLSRIFERFYRVDKARSRALGGTGLGLAIVKHVAQAHGGRVSVDSIPGQGSVFRIHLPGAGHGGDAPGADSPRLPERPYG